MRSLDSSPETGASYRRGSMRIDRIATELWASAAGEGDAVFDRDDRWVKE